MRLQKGSQGREVGVRGTAQSRAPTQPRKKPLKKDVKARRTGSNENLGTRLREGETVRTLGRDGQFLQRLNTESPKTKQLPSWAHAWEKRKRAHQAQGSALCDGQDVGTAPCPAADSGSANRGESWGAVLRQTAESSADTCSVVHSENFMPSKRSQTQRATYGTVT